VQEIVYAELNDHVTDDVTRPYDVIVVTYCSTHITSPMPACLLSVCPFVRPSEVQWSYRLGYFESNYIDN